MLNEIVMLGLVLQLTSPVALIGRWDSVQRSRGGLGTWMEFSADGACYQTLGALVDGTWKLEGGQLTVSMVVDQTGTRQDQVATITFDGNSPTQTVNNQRRRLERRAGAMARAAAIVGVWEYTHYTGSRAYEEYTEDGRFHFRLPMSSDPCTWSITGDQIRVTVGKKEQVFSWEVTGERLTLERDGSRQAYRREQSNVIPPVLR